MVGSGQMQMGQMTRLCRFYTVTVYIMYICIIPTWYVYCDCVYYVYMHYTYMVCIFSNTEFDLETLALR